MIHEGVYQHIKVTDVKCQKIIAWQYIQIAADRFIVNHIQWIKHV